MKKLDTPKFANQPITISENPSPRRQSNEPPEKRKRRLARYGKMTAYELIEHFIESPEFCSEFYPDAPKNWYWAFNEMYLYIFRNFPDSPLRYENYMIPPPTTGIDPCLPLGLSSAPLMISIGKNLSSSAPP